MKSISLYLERFQRYGVKNVQLFWDHHVKIPVKIQTIESAGGEHSTVTTDQNRKKRICAICFQLANECKVVKKHYRIKTLLGRITCMMHAWHRCGILLDTQCGLCVFAGQRHELCKNGWTNWYAIWGVDASRPREPWAQIPRRGNFWGISGPTNWQLWRMSKLFARWPSEAAFCYQYCSKLWLLLSLRLRPHHPWP